jgi:hypothetical protein
MFFTQLYNIVVFYNAGNLPEARIVQIADQGCQMVYFQTKNLNMGIFRRALECIVLLYFITVWNILRPIGIMYGRLV